MAYKEFMFKCSACGANGHLTCSEETALQVGTLPCPVCFTTGILELTAVTESKNISPEYKYQCENCGKLFLGYWHKCPDCGKTGKVKLRKEHKTVMDSLGKTYPKELWDSRRRDNNQPAISVDDILDFTKDNKAKKPKKHFIKRNWRKDNDKTS